MIAVEKRLDELRVQTKCKNGARATLYDGQVLVVLRGENGRPNFIGGFFSNSDIGREFRRILKLTKPG